MRTFMRPREQGQFVSSLVSGFALPRWVEAISAWCEASRGEISIETALSELLVASGADAGMLVRIRSADGQATRIATADRGRHVTRPLRLSYAGEAFGEYLETARAGTVWVQSAGDLVETPALHEFQSARGLAEFAVLTLSGRSEVHEFIELHFHNRLEEPAQAMFAGVLGVLARNWAARKVGLVARATAQSKVVGMRQKTQFVDILGPDNPAQLSRAEFRVCLLLSRGLSVRGVCGEFDLTEATVRSHLRNIYAKTNTSSLAELVYLLMSNNPREEKTLASRIA